MAVISSWTYTLEDLNQQANVVKDFLLHKLHEDGMFEGDIDDIKRHYCLVYVKKSWFERILKKDDDYILKLIRL